MFGKAFCPVKISGKMDRYREQPVLEKQRRRCFVIYEERKEETNKEKQAEDESGVSGAAFRKEISKCFFYATATEKDAQRQILKLCRSSGGECMNNTIMMGRLVRDPQINYVENGKGDEMAVANFRLAVDRKFSDDTDYFPCAAFGRLAEFAEKYLFQGIKVVVNGRMENNNYTNKDGDKVYGVCLKLNEIEFAESKNAGRDDDEDGGGRNRNSGNRRNSSGGRGSSSGSRSGSRNSGSSRSGSGRSSGSSRGGYQNSGSGNSRSSRGRNVDEEFEGMEDGYFD